MTTTSIPQSTSSPRRIAIIGAGIAGASAALALRRDGHDVTLYSDKTRRALRDDVPATGTAILFGASRTPDARVAAEGYGAEAAFTASAVAVNGGPAFDAAYAYEAQSVDVRRRVDDRLGAFLELGGRFEVAEIDTRALDAIAAEHEATFVATGKGGLADLFPVDGERSPYTEPQRHLLTVTVAAPASGALRFPGRTAAERSALLSIDPEEGEVFVGPYLHKDAGAAWVLLGFARPGTDTERAYRSAHDAASALEVFKAQHHAQFPDVAPQIDSLAPLDDDPHSWLAGAVTPTVRHPVARTAGGHLVVALGDTAIAVDPIAGQGAQLGAFQVAALVDALAETSDATTDGVPVATTDATPAWDEAFFTELFDRHWAEHGRASVEATSLFLGDPRYAEVAGAFFGAAEADPAVGTALFDLLSEPGPVLSLRDGRDVDAFVRGFSGTESTGRTRAGAPA